VQNNPINRGEPDGALNSPIYGEDGKFLGVDSEGFAGNVVVMNEFVYIRVTDGGTKTLDHNFTTALVDNTSVASNLENANISVEANSNILTDVTLRTEGVDFSRLEGDIINIIDTPIDDEGNMGQINGASFGNATNFSMRGEAGTKANPDGTINVTSRLLGGQSQFNTVEHIQSVLGIHEFQGHGVNDYSRFQSGERRADMLQFRHKSTFNKLTKYQQDNIKEGAGIN
jgi:hypothetical protein